MSTLKNQEPNGPPEKSVAGGSESEEGILSRTLYGQKRFERKKIIRQVLASVAISLASVALIFFFFAQRGIVVDLSVFRPAWFFVGLITMVGKWLLDGTRVFLSARAWKKRLRFRDAVGAVLSGHFVSAITPFSTGGSPVQAFVLARSGLTWGEAGSFVVITGILFQFSPLLLFIVMMGVFRIGFTLRGFLLDLLYFFAVFYSALLLMLFYLLLYPKTLYRLINWGMRVVRRRLRRIKFNEDVVWKWINDFMGDFRRGFKIFILQKPQYLIWNLGCYLVQSLMSFSVAQLVLLSLGAQPSYLAVVESQIPLFYVFALTPSPGASGAVEFSIASAFLRFAGAERLGVFVLFWRLSTYYFTLLIGGLTLFFILKKNGKQTSSGDTGGAGEPAGRERLSKKTANPENTQTQV
ncbi:MAG TPA: lysylphosphatidylglycerol synthase transmembrane domain-containing protein [Atribacteraceae bacterium]|nr:lysylphosphatidylglycerol synthase transmembrane domain-containing protein [Atribacteraceae bacterium]